MNACLTNAYDGATSRLIRSETSGQPATTYLYDERGEMAATVQGGVKTASETRYENIGGAWWRVDVRSTSREGVTNAVATTRRQLTGLSNALRSRTVSIDPNGSTTTETSSFNPQTCELTTIRATDSATPLVAVSKFGRPIVRESLREVACNYFDPLGRVEYSEVSNPEAGSYSRWSGLDESDNETDYGVYYDDDLHVTGSRTYDAFNRETSHTDTFGNTVTTTYDALGRPVGASGATYPVQNGYDAMGRTKTLSTTRDGTTWDVTSWGYDPATGLVTNKVYADGSAVSYAYTPDGKLVARAWACGLATAYAYNPDGLLTGVSYSDATPAASLGYDAFQRLASASNAIAQYSFANDNLGTATNETVTLGGTVSTLTRGMDSRHRLAALRVGDAPPVQYGYDVENRLSTVSNSAFVAEYNYTSDGWDAGYGVTLTNGVTLARNLTRDPYRRSLITAITNTVNGAATASLVYDYDKQNRVTSRNYDTFSYNARSEITAASVQSNAYAYAYDSIGNHTTASVNAATTAYTANALNQYSQISVLSVPSVDNPTYDLDGNLLTNGIWSYTWDCENRLIAAYSNNVCVVSNAYDHMSRRVLKITPNKTHSFIYDNWNLIQETISTVNSTATNLYIWGRDLSGTLQGAGGVGGLLAVWKDEAWHFPLYDNNGNITAYVGESGSIVVEYVYDAYGGTIAASGSMSDTFRHRFSTKYFDAEIGLYYYGYRFYDPMMRRWLNRDPIEERGGINLYQFVFNCALMFTDSNGRAPQLIGVDESGTGIYSGDIDWGDNPLGGGRIYIDPYVYGLNIHYIELRNKLQNQLQAMCPGKPTSWGGTGSGAAKCCTPRECMGTAWKIADAYIDALKKAYMARKVPGGDPGNVLLTCWAGLSPFVTTDQITNHYPNDPGKLSPGFVCSGWQQLALDAINPIVKDSPCWNYKMKSREKTIKIKKTTFRYYHEWGSVSVMDGPDLDLDPWPSGGWHY